MWYTWNMHHTDVPTLHGQAVPDWRARLRVRLVRPGEWDRWKQLMAAHHYLLRITHIYIRQTYDVKREPMRLSQNANICIGGH